jgi:hypothetical protein
MKFLKTILGYFTYASTWKGLVAILTAGGLVLSPEQAAAITAAGLGVVGLIQVFVDDQQV